MKKNKKLFIIFTIFIICMGLFLLNFMRIESDYFWHIKAGETMFRNGILTHDVFSWYLNGKYWMSHEWLFEIILNLFKIAFPVNHILVYGFVFINLLLLIIFFTNKDKFSKNILFSLFWIVLSVILLPFMQARPHMMSFSLLALTIWVLFDNYNNRDSKVIYLLPIISMLWANIHGGSSNLSYLLCLVFLISGLFSFKFKKIESERISFKQIKKYIIVFFLSIITICINIHGFKMLLYPYQNMADTVMLNNITEWAPTNLNIANHYIYIVFIAFILVVLLISEKRFKLIDLLLFGLSLFLGFKSVRFWSYTYIIMSYVIFDYVKERNFGKEVYVCLLLLSCTFVFGTVININSIKKQITNHQLSDDVITIIKKEQPSKLFNMYDYGGELINNDIPVFIDGRADLYSKYNFVDYLSISNLSGDYTKLIEKYDFDYYLISKRFPIYNYMLHADDYYNILYEDDTTVLYKKNS